MTRAEIGNLIDAILKKGYEQGRSSLNDEQRVVYDVDNCEISICMDGLAGYYSSKWGVNVEAVIVALRRLGNDEGASLLSSATQLICGGEVPATRDELERIVDSLDDDTCYEINTIGVRMVPTVGRMLSFLFPFLEDNEAQICEGLEDFTITCETDPTSDRGQPD